MTFAFKQSGHLSRGS